MEALADGKVHLPHPAQVMTYMWFSDLHDAVIDTFYAKKTENSDLMPNSIGLLWRPELEEAYSWRVRTLKHVDSLRILSDGDLAFWVEAHGDKLQDMTVHSRVTAYNYLYHPGDVGDPDKFHDNNFVQYYLDPDSYPLFFNGDMRKLAAKTLALRLMTGWATANRKVQETVNHLQAVQRSSMP